MEIIRIGSRKCKGCKKRTQCYKLADTSQQLCRKCFPHEIPENRGKATGNPTGRNTAPARKALREKYDDPKWKRRKIEKSKVTRTRNKLAKFLEDMIPADSIPIGHRLALRRIQCKKCKGNANPENITHISTIIPKRGPREVICGSCGVIE